jgi:hypothetical protein
MYAFFPSSDRANDSGAAHRRQHRQAAGTGAAAAILVFRSRPQKQNGANAVSEGAKYAHHSRHKGRRAQRSCQ